MVDGLSKSVSSVSGQLQNKEYEYLQQIQEQQEIAQAQQIERVSSTRSTRGDTYTEDPQTVGGGFRLSVNHIYKLMQRFRMGQFTYQDLQSMEISQLSSEEKGFVRYLQRNPEYFGKFASLNQDPSAISTDDVHTISQLSHDPMYLTSTDLENLREQGFPVDNINQDLLNIKERQITSTSQAADDAHRAATIPPPSVVEMEAILRQIAQQIGTQQPNPNPPPNGQDQQPPTITYNQLMGVNPYSLALSPAERDRLAYLRTPAVGGLLDTISQDNNQQQFITVDVLRIMSSLINNPMVYGTLYANFIRPVVDQPVTPEEPIEEAVPSAEVGDIEEQNVQPLLAERYFIHASDILAICHQVSPSGNMTLEQVRHYQPSNEQEAETLNLLRNGTVFQALANFGSENTILGDEAIHRAAKGNRVIVADRMIEIIIQS